MDAIGGQVNAYTTKEHTCFYARSLDKHLDISLDILSDMLFHSRFDQGDVETERGVVLEEIGMYEDSPEDLVSERLAAAVAEAGLRAKVLCRTSGDKFVTHGALSCLKQELGLDSAGIFRAALEEVRKHG